MNKKERLFLKSILLTLPPLMILWGLGVSMFKSAPAPVSIELAIVYLFATIGLISSFTSKIVLTPFMYVYRKLGWIK